MSQASTTDVMFDTHPPSVGRDTGADSCSKPGDNGWCRGTQTAGFTATDASSGTASPCTAAAGGSCNFTRSGSTEGSAVTIGSGRVCDVAGNCATDSQSAGPFKIDHTPPALAPTVGPTPILLHGTATATANATDATSGVAFQNCLAANTGTAGMHTLTCSARDNAGNGTGVTVSYLVQYKILGFFAPVPNSRWKTGQTVSIKIALADANGNRIPDSEAQGLSNSCRVIFSASGVQAVPQPACARYDTTNRLFFYNWKLGSQTGNDTITMTVSYPGTNQTTTISQPITITN
jgi:hypothetical protein